MKKTLGMTLLSCILVVMLALTACSKGSSGGSKDSGSSAPASQPAQSSAAASQASGEKVKLVLWIWDSAKKVIDLNMPAFQAKYPNIEIEFQVMNTTDVYQKFLIAANSGDKVPDVVTLETSRMAQMVNAGALLDMTAQVEPYKEKMNAYKWADATKDGKVYAMPWDSGPVVMFYRNDLFAKAGLPTKPEEVASAIQTWDQFVTAAKAVKDKAGAFMLSDSKTKSDSRIFETMMWQRGLWYFDDSGKVTLDSPEVKEIGKFYSGLMKDGYVYDAEPWGESWLNALKEGKVATIVGASWFDGLLSGWIDPDGKGKWSVAPMPKWAVNDQYASANDGGSNFAINKNSEHPEEAWKFIEFMLGQDDSQIKMLKDGGFFPSLESTYGDEAYTAPVDYFGGQPIRKMFVDAVKEIKPQAYTADYPTANQLMGDAWAKIHLNNEDVNAVFDATAKELRQKTKRE